MKSRGMSRVVSCDVSRAMNGKFDGNFCQYSYYWLQRWSWDDSSAANRATATIPTKRAHEPARVLRACPVLSQIGKCATIRTARTTLTMRPPQRHRAVEMRRARCDIVRKCAHHFVLLMASPKPGVSTKVSFKLTPPSTRYTVEFCTWGNRLVLSG